MMLLKPTAAVDSEFTGLLKRHEDGGVARLESAGGDDRAPALSATLHGWRRDQPARGARALSRQDGVPHPRHQSTLDHLHHRLLWMQQPYPRGRHGYL